VARGTQPAALLASPGLGHGEALTAIAAEFSGCRGERIEERLDEASRWLFGAASLGAQDQAHAIAELLTNRLGLRSEASDYRALLVDQALERCSASPLVIAVLGHELGRRSGIRTAVAGAGGHFWTLVRGEEGTALVGPTSPPASGCVRPRCPHQVAHAALARLSLLAPPDGGARAERLLAALPVRGCRRGTPTER
jgi:hypothetical protein